MLPPLLSTQFRSVSPPEASLPFLPPLTLTGAQALRSSPWADQTPTDSQGRRPCETGTWWVRSVSASWRRFHRGRMGTRRGLGDCSPSWGHRGVCPVKFH